MKSGWLSILIISLTLLKKSGWLSILIILTCNKGFLDYPLDLWVIMFYFGLGVIPYPYSHHNKKWLSAKPLSKCVICQHNRQRSNYKGSKDVTAHPHDLAHLPPFGAQVRAVEREIKKWLSSCCKKSNKKWFSSCSKKQKNIAVRAVKRTKKQFCN